LSRTLSRPAASRLTLWQRLNRPVGRWGSSFVLALLLVVVLWVWRDVRVGMVVSDSMKPTLQRGDYYVIRIDAYRKRGPQHGDVVVIKHPQGHEILIKRVLGVGGDWISVVNGHAWVNGEWLVEPYLKKAPDLPERPVFTKVPDGQLFLMGDNRNLSEDSRDIGTLPAKQVIGRATRIVWPLKRRARLDGVDLKVPDTWTPPVGW
jgi:signal peptidase I